MKASSARATGSAFSLRLSQLSQLDEDELQALGLAERDQRRWPARREIVAEGAPVREPRALLSGWACRQRILSDGRRQILSFVLPGDLIGVCPQSNPVSSTTILAVTEVVTCAVPDARADKRGLAEAYALSTALDEHFLFAQITRLGRLSALERLADWILETHDRLLFAGMADPDRLPLPLTQEFLADTLGLTSVHVNRTLQTMRRDGLLTSRAGMIVLPDRDRLERLVDYKPARVTAR